MQIIDIHHLEFSSWRKPTALIVYTTQSFDSSWICEIRERYPEMIVMGMSSYHGVIHREGFCRGIYGILIEAEDHVLFRAMAIDLLQVEDVRAQVRLRLEPWKDELALRHFFIHATQGDEERVLEGIEDAIPEAHIFGATPGCDTFLGQGYVFLNETMLTRGVLILQFLSERVLCNITCGGYLAMQKKGVVTRAKGRVIEEIDGRPAAEVYNEWTDGMFDAYFRRGGALPRSIGLYPIGRICEEDSKNKYWIVHPWFVDARQKSLRVFAEIPVNSRIQQMRGTEDSIELHIGMTIRKLFEQVDRSQCLFAFVMYCSGCASIISIRMDRVCEQALKAFGDLPFLGCTSFGEQGRLDGALQNHHGNMMIEIVLVMKDH